MAVAKSAAKTPRTATREPDAPRMEARMPDRDPHAIYTRDGRKIDLAQVAGQDDDYTNLAKMGVFPEPGWTYEWRTRKIKNAEYTKGIVADHQAGWTPVPASRHPGKLMPVGFDGPIEHDGQMLMERPTVAVQISRKVQGKSANEQLQISRSMTGLMQRAVPNAPADMLDFNSGDATRSTGVKIDRIPMGDPVKNYQYTLDE